VPKKYFPAIIIILFLAISSLEPVIIKLGYQVHVNPFEMIVMRALATGILILPFCTRFEWIGWKHFPNVLMVCILFTAINVLFYWALQDLTAITVITFSTLTPGFVGLVNSLQGKETLGKTFWPGFFLCFLGVVLTIGLFSKGIGSISYRGILFMLLVIAASTIYRTTMDTLTRDKNPLLISNYLFLSHALFGLCCLPFIEVNIENTWKFSTCLAFTAIMGNIAFLWSIKLLGATKISIWGILQRPIVIVVSAFVLKEKLDLSQLAGVVLVLVGIQMAKVKRVAK
jgi:drug/metabolite transporter (DMT)-like permease